MPFDVAEALRTRHGENYELHEKHLNHQLARVLKTIGFDQFYVRGEGSYLFDAEGERYLDFLSGFGVYALGRSHPALKALKWVLVAASGILADQVVIAAEDA